MSEYLRMKGKIVSMARMSTKAGKIFWKVGIQVDGKQYPVKGTTFDDVMAYTANDLLDISYTEAPAVDKATGQPMISKYGKPIINRNFLLPNHICKDGTVLKDKQISVPSTPPVSTAPAGGVIAALEKRIAALEVAIGRGIPPVDEPPVSDEPDSEISF